mmetsp:Transcript_5202/g.11628  ORF Transcript_5202/g.11628 Transcript_5202/m.11628 type:complete len:146 (-) Transcript_5202:1659-2096(-)
MSNMYQLLSSAGAVDVMSSKDRLGTEETKAAEEDTASTCSSDDGDMEYLTLWEDSTVGSVKKTHRTQGMERRETMHSETTVPASNRTCVVESRLLEKYRKFRALVKNMESKNQETGIVDKGGSLKDEDRSQENCRDDRGRSPQTV